MKKIITGEMPLKRYHLHEIDELTLERIVKVCRYCTITRIFYSVKMQEECWENFYKNKIILESLFTKEEYTFLNINLTREEFKLIENE